jgi:histidinol dehydrogenase
MKIVKNLQVADYSTVLIRPQADTLSLMESVKGILADVKKEGDAALRTYTEKFDNVRLETFLVSDEEIQNAENQIDTALKAAISVAKANIELFHAQQKTGVEIVQTMPGVQCWRKSVGIERVGLYIPGGTAPLFSTVLMLGIPAKLAGCREIVLCSPPTTSGSIHPAILYAAKLVGVDKIFKIGGVQSIAAMAYGTESVPQVYKIFGPGNAYVTAAKQCVSTEGTAIDMPAGPSEVMVIADNTAQADFVAADLLSQAEHGADSQVVLVAQSEAFIEQVLFEIEQLSQKMPREAYIQKALQHSLAIVAQDSEQALDIANFYAPEHLILQTQNAEIQAEKVINAGSVFIGHWSPESVGDYASGTNHTLPTNGFAKAYSGVSLDSFTRKITFQKLTPEGLTQISETVIRMAEAEALQAHAEAVRVRLAKIEKKQTL